MSSDRIWFSLNAISTALSLLRNSRIHVRAEAAEYDASPRSFCEIRLLMVLDGYMCPSARTVRTPMWVMTTSTSCSYCSSSLPGCKMVCGSACSVRFIEYNSGLRTDRGQLGSNPVLASVGSWNWGKVTAIQHGQFIRRPAACSKGRIVAPTDTTIDLLTDSVVCPARLHRLKSSDRADQFPCCP
jgi:hypothetical protein